MKAKLLKGFTQLLSKSVVASAVGFITLLVVIQVIGVDEYGKYAGAFSILLFLELLLKFEIKLVLVKQDFESNPGVFHTAFTLLLGISGLMVAFMWLFLKMLPESLNPYQEFTAPFLLLSLVLSVSVLAEIPRAVLERKMKFKLISKQELASALLQHATCLVLVFMHESLAALIVSWYVYNGAIFLLSWRASGYTPAINIDRKELPALLYHSRHLFSQNMLSQGKRLVNPLIVGYFVGPQGVGIVSFAEKIVQGLSFFKNALHRVAISMLGVLKDDDDRLLKSVKEATLLQMLPLGGIMLVGSVAIYIVSIWTGDDLWHWMNRLYPFLAVGFFFFVILTIPTTALQMHKGLKDVTVFWIIFNLIFFLTAFVSVKTFGVIGYGIAELAAVPAYFILFRSLRRQIGEVLTNEMIILMVCIPITLMWYYIGFLSLFSLPVLFLLPDMLKGYRKIWQDIKGT